MSLHLKLSDAVLLLVALRGQLATREIDESLSQLDLAGDVPVYPNRVAVAVYNATQRGQLVRHGRREGYTLGPQAPRWATMLAEACAEAPALGERWRAELRGVDDA